MNALHTVHIEDLPWNEYDTIVAAVVKITTKIVELRMRMKPNTDRVYRILRPKDFQAKPGQVLDLIKINRRGATAIRLSRVIPKTVRESYE